MNEFTCSECKEKISSEEYKVTQNKSKCILHCEKDTWYTKDKFKKLWDKEKVSFFWIKIREKIKDYTDNKETVNNYYLDLKGTIFPLFEDAKETKDSINGNSIWYHNFSENVLYQDNYKLEIAVDFTKSKFLEKADFSKKICTKRILFDDVKFMNGINFYKSHFEEVSFREAEFQASSLFNECTLAPLLDSKKEPLKLQFENTIFRKDIQFNKVNLGVENNNKETKYQLCLDKTKFHSRAHFINCNFFDKLTITDIESKWFLSLKSCKFNNLKIKSTLTRLEIIGNNKEVINNLNISNTQIDKLIINNYTINNRLNLNSINKINNINFDELIFNKKVEMKNCNINNLSLQNTKFEQTADFFGSKFNIINLYKTTFEEVVVFENTLFKSDIDFKFTTFSKLGTFKNSNCKKLLNFDDAIIHGEMNFLNINTNIITRETARIIKHSFEKIGNKIEANKFHILEMEQYRKEVWRECKNSISCQLLLDGIVLFFHWLSSNHSSSWLRALFWIFFIGISTTIISNENISFNNIFMFSSILTKIDAFDCDYILLSLNKVSLGYLYYQFLISVRKDTRK